jgi:hypothetical protein
MLKGKKGQHDDDNDERQLEKAAEKPQQAYGGKNDEKDDYTILGQETGNGIHHSPSMCCMRLITTIPL